MSFSRAETMQNFQKDSAVITSWWWKKRCFYINPCGEDVTHFVMFMTVGSTIKLMSLWWIRNGRKHFASQILQRYEAISWVVPPPRMPVANKGLVRDPLLKI